MVRGNDSRPAERLARAADNAHGNGIRPRGQVDAQGNASLDEQVQFVRPFTFAEYKSVLHHKDIIADARHLVENVYGNAYK